MDPSRLSRLSDRQKDCLRLVYQNYNAKQIGRKLDISPNTVNRHLQDARMALGLSRSMDAAILLVKAEGGHRITTDQLAIVPSNGAEHEVSAMAPGSGVLARNRYTLGVLQRVGLILAIAFIAVALAGALLVGAEAITRIFWDYRIDISDSPYRQ